MRAKSLFSWTNGSGEHCLGVEGAIEPGEELVAGEVLGRHRGVEHVDHGRPPGHGVQLLAGNIFIKIFLLSVLILLILLILIFL